MERDIPEKAAVHFARESRPRTQVASKNRAGARSASHFL
jgi:hypothetical protein